MSEEYQMRNINLDRLAEYVRSNDGLSETPTLHLLDTIRCLQDFGGDLHRQLCLVVNERDRLEAEVATLQSLVLHPGDGTCYICGSSPAHGVPMCEGCCDSFAKIEEFAAEAVRG